MSKKIIVVSIGILLLLSACIDRENEEVIGEKKATLEDVKKYAFPKKTKNATDDEYKKSDSIRTGFLNKEAEDTTLEAVDPDKIKPPQH